VVVDHLLDARERVGLLVADQVDGRGCALERPRGRGRRRRRGRDPGRGRARGRLL